eukprot:11994042-Alexandrium_andersonii.AAC.1
MGLGRPPPQAFCTPSTRTSRLPACIHGDCPQGCQDGRRGGGPRGACGGPVGYAAKAPARSRL